MIDTRADTPEKRSLKQTNHGVKYRYEKPTMTVTTQSQGLRLDREH